MRHSVSDIFLFIDSFVRNNYIRRPATLRTLSWSPDLPYSFVLTETGTGQTGSLLAAYSLVLEYMHCIFRPHVARIHICIGPWHESHTAEKIRASLRNIPKVNNGCKCWLTLVHAEILAIWILSLCPLEHAYIICGFLSSWKRGLPYGFDCYLLVDIWFQMQELSLYYPCIGNRVIPIFCRSIDIKRLKCADHLHPPGPFLVPNCGFLHLGAKGNF